MTYRWDEEASRRRIEELETRLGQQERASRQEIEALARARQEREAELIEELDAARRRAEGPEETRSGLEGGMLFPALSGVIGAGFFAAAARGLVSPWSFMFGAIVATAIGAVVGWANGRRTRRAPRR